VAARETPPAADRCAPNKATSLCYAARAMRWRAVFGVTVGSMGFLLGLGLAVWLVLWVSLRTSVVRVPTVVGKLPHEALAMLQEDGLLGRLQEGVFDANVPAGRVAVQRPAPGFALKRGAAVLLHVSLGNAAQAVPDVTGLPVALAQAQIEAQGLSVLRRCEVEGQASATVVLAVSPPPRTMVPPGSGVVLLANRGVRQRAYVMPDFVGESEVAATAAIRNFGFRLASLQRVAYPGIKAGIVLRQDPPAGAMATESALVALWISR